MYCEFEKVGKGHYQCKRCGFNLRVQLSLDDPSSIYMNCPKAQPKDKPPSTAKKTANFTRSMIEFAKNNFKTVDEEEQKRRLEICGGCEFFKNRKCSKCGCNMDFKSKLAHEDCPIGKWDK